MYCYQDDDEWKEHDAVDATNENPHNDGDDDTSDSENSVRVDFRNIISISYIALSKHHLSIHMPLSVQRTI